jgi:hypothetical protein
MRTMMLNSVSWVSAGPRGEDPGEDEPEAGADAERTRRRGAVAQGGLDPAPSQTTAVAPAEEMRTMMLNSVSWSAVLAGATVATAVVWEGAGSRPGWRPGATGVASLMVGIGASWLIAQVILNMLGLGIGLSTVDPLGDGTPAASSLGIM